MSLPQSNIDWARYMDGLQGKVNTNCDNMTHLGKENIVRLSRLSDREDHLTLGASGTWYTAPADGFFFLGKFTKGQEFIQLYNGNTCFLQYTGMNNWLLCALMPVKKGEKCQCNYNATGKTENFGFIYAEGSK